MNTRARMAALLATLGVALAVPAQPRAGDKRTADGNGSTADRVNAFRSQQKTQDLSPEERTRLQREATALNTRAEALLRQGKYHDAIRLFRDALAMRRQLYPETQFPGGHPYLAESLNNLGFQLYVGGAYPQAELYLRDALAMYRKLYPVARYADGHPHVAIGLYNLGLLLEARGAFAEAERCFRDALAMRYKLYPASAYPDGHPYLAMSLNTLGSLLRERGEYAQAEPYYRDALAMCRKLYPAARFPDGEPGLATCLNHLAALLLARGEYAQAEPHVREALAMNRKLYPASRYPEGHPDLANSLNNLAALLQRRGDYAQAEPYLRDALAMHRKLYPAARFPDGHPELANSLNNLGSQLRSRRDYAQAELYYRDALAMRGKLYAPARYPRGHRELAHSLNDLGTLLAARGAYAQAEPYLRDALAMRRNLYAAARYPDGHPDLAQSLSELGAVLRARGQYAQAEPYLRDALAMDRKLYPAARYADGHPNLAVSLNGLAILLASRGEYAQAELYYRDALAMDRKLYPAARYPDGNPHLAVGLKNVGHLLHTRGDRAGAEPFVRDALAMCQRLAATFADAAAEGETLNLLSQIPDYRDEFLSVTAARPDASAAAVYAVLWQGRAVLARALERRQRLVHELRDEADRARLRELLAVRARLARLVLALDRQQKDRAQLLQQLSDRKEDLEKALAAKLPQLGDVQAPYTALAAALPEDAAFLDLYRHRHRTAETNKWPLHYVAFVLRKAKAPVRVELGPAEPIDKALAAWRQHIAAGLDSNAADELRRLLWDKLAPHLPAGPDSTVYLCPDAALSALPWAALPGRVKGTVLLEDHALALVPHGPGLLDQLRLRDHKRPAGPGLLLALGGVRYDQPPAVLLAPTDPVRPPGRSERDGVWPALPGTAREVDHVAALARGLHRPPRLLQRSGNEAGPGQLLLDLPQARWAHLATHGFFAAPASGARKYLFDEKDFLRGMKGERVGVAARHPLTQTGLVLAGANLKGKDASPDGSIVTAEALAGLNLSGLELAVLSACETGLGEAASNEGVFGLQRAFHLGGCKNVVASLWKVDDDATAALMAVFYHELWVKGAPPLQALRRAQLALYHHPQDVPVLARSRGPDFDTTVRRVTQPPPAKGPRPPGRAAVKDWAAFVLSGAGW